MELQNSWIFTDPPYSVVITIAVYLVPGFTSAKPFNQFFF